MKKTSKLITDWSLKRNIGTQKILLGFSIWLFFTSIFGFNDTATNWIEILSDRVSLILIIWGIIEDAFSQIIIKNNIQLNFEDKFFESVSKHLKKEAKKKTK